MNQTTTPISIISDYSKSKQNDLMSCAPNWNYDVKNPGNFDKTIQKIKSEVIDPIYKTIKEKTCKPADFGNYIVGLINMPQYMNRIQYMLILLIFLMLICIILQSLNYARA